MVAYRYMQFKYTIDYQEKKYIVNYKTQQQLGQWTSTTTQIHTYLYTAYSWKIREYL